MIGAEEIHEFRKIEQAYTYLIETLKVFQKWIVINTWRLDEQNAMYLNGKTDLDLETIAKN